MNDPTQMVDCPVCAGKGLFEAPKCPHPPDTEVNCSKCQYDGLCGQSRICDCCDGRGEVKESFYRTALKEIER